MHSAFLCVCCPVLTTVKESERVRCKMSLVWPCGTVNIDRLLAGGLENWNLISCGSRYFSTRLRIQKTVGPTRLPVASGCVTFRHLQLMASSSSPVSLFEFYWRLSVCINRQVIISSMLAYLSLFCLSFLPFAVNPADLLELCLAFFMDGDV